MPFKSLSNENVRYLELGDVCEIQTGFGVKTSFYRDNGFPIIKGENIHGGQITTDNLSYCNPNNHPNAPVIKYGDIVIVSHGCPGKVGINLTDREFFFSNNVHKLIPDETVLIKKYLYHCLLNKQEEIKGLAKGSSQPFVGKSVMRKLKIPIYCLETQTKIVETLDKFQELKQELKQELLLRKRQHSYYRDQIWRPLLGNLTE
ncbi:type I restriction-modification system, S subunit [Mycoplasma haemofelis str. Langford 1]|uniref:Type I restriction enzyme specificity HsdS domain protein n=2 Tax=Mycoplasma haemofelis TaxID=29501 RepID=F6FIK8_MYCHI|nr:restriction endonuclease subunit S [Mycoplasma haemofelis]AEG73056.1 type I restriction enzyme specificity HsdS domain protein [Mycoplasma haemofelis Ohio2]CBY92721.1 type I restriction-modification system, S subunit [Mycoplasma haemofelis str. Langford 1]